MSKLIELVDMFGFQKFSYGKSDDTDAADKADALHAELRTRLEALERDAARLDALEAMANQPGGILLHDGSESGRVGLGLRPGAVVRTLREAIDTAMEAANVPER